jgi:hypothetical protein
LVFVVAAVLLERHLQRPGQESVDVRGGLDEG